MNSLETLKQEILNQKVALESKGVNLTPKSTNPSPSEITEGINSIVYADLSQATATEADVVSGKTFYSGDNTLKTGNKLSGGDASLATFVCGLGSHEIAIPTDPECTIIRDYCYTINKDNFSSSCFYKHDLTIPSNIKFIGGYAFSFTPITGTLTVHSDCQILGLCAFRGSEITHAIFAGTFQSTTKSGYCFAYCPNLVSVTLLEGINIIPNYTFQFSPLLEKIVLPASITKVGGYNFKGSTSLQFVKFQSTTPPTLESAAFVEAVTIPILVPHDYYYDYFTATNYQKKGNPIIGYKTYNAGDALPASNDNFTITWHTTIQDAVNGTNPITSVDETAELYGQYTSV